MQTEGTDVIAAEASITRHECKPKRRNKSEKKIFRLMLRRLNEANETEGQADRNAGDKDLKHKNKQKCT